MKNLITYDLLLEEITEGVQRISLVENPAIEKDFITFSAESVQFSISTDKQIITTPVLIAGQRIYRNDPVRGEHLVRFSKATIEEVVLKYFKEGRTFDFNLEHSDDVKGIYLFESYIVNKERGIMPPQEFKGVSDGSWIASFKIDNPRLWSAIKAGQFKGVSMEGFFSYSDPTSLEKAKFNADLSTDDITLLQAILNDIQTNLNN